MAPPSFDVNIWTGIFTFTGLSLCILLLALCFAFYAFFMSDHGKNISTRVKSYSMLSIFLFATAQLFIHLYIGYCKLPHGTVSTETLSLWCIWNSLWSMGYCCTYLLFYERLRATFKGTVYRLTKLKSILFFALLTLYFVTTQSITVISLISAFQYMGEIHDVISQEDFLFYFPILSWTRFSIDWLLNILVIYLFCNKIVKLTIIKGTPKSSGFQNDHSPKIFGFVYMHLFAFSD